LHGPLVTLERRKVWIIEAIPKDPGYCYSKRLWYLNPETFWLHNSHMYDRTGGLWKNYWMINLPVKNRPEIGGYSQVLVAGSCNDFRIWEGGPFTLVCKPNIPIPMTHFTIDWLRRMGR
jgi:hypothetical protein